MTQTDNPNMFIFQNAIQAYDALFGNEEVAKNPDKLTEEEIDAILGIQGDMDQAANWLILASKIYAARRSIAEKNEKLCKTLLHRILMRTWVKEFESEDGKAKFVPAYQFDTDIAALPEDYKMASYGKINSALLKWEKVEWVTVTGGFPSIRIS